MTRTAGFAALALLAASYFGCTDLGTSPPGDHITPPQPGPLTAAEKALVSAGNDFGFRLIVAVNRDYAGQNVFISPLSVSMALGMTMNGARGATRSAMASTLGFGAMAQADINRSYSGINALLTGLDPTVQMQIANSIWYRPTMIVVDTFKTVNMTYFNAEVNSIDFSSPSAPGVINGWVSQHTAGRITSIITPPIPAGVMMYLINAIYFKGSWTYKYDPQYTAAKQFTRDDGSQVTCSMMSQTDTIPYCATAGGVQVVDIPYGSGAFSMTVVLPPAGVNIDAFVGSLTQEQWNSWIAGLSRRPVAIWMPKFKLQYGAVSLATTLKALGMSIAFSGDADFTGIDHRGSLAISDVLHKTFVQVDDDGTEAAAVTAVVMVGAVLGGEEEPVYLNLNRPFLYAIREHATGSLVFIGKLAYPEWTD